MPCRFCGQKLPENARYCSQCDHWLSWWGPWLKLFNPSDLLVAGTLFAFFWGIARPLLWGSYAVLEVTVLSSDDAVVQAVMANSGDRDSVVYGVEFSLEDQHEVSVPGHITVDENRQDTVLLRSGGAAKVVAFTIPIGSETTLDAAANMDACTLVISVLATGQRVEGDSVEVASLECEEVL